jgi:hypothetical protein
MHAADLPQQLLSPASAPRTLILTTFAFERKICTMASVHGKCDNKSGLGESDFAPETIATLVAAPAPSSGPEDYDDMPSLEQAPPITSATTTPLAQGTQGDGSAPSSMSLPMAPPNPFVMLAQALIAAGPPPGFENETPTDPYNLPAALGGLFSVLDGDDDEDEDEDATESETDDEDNDMSSLKTAMPSTTPSPLGIQASIYANMAQSVANTLESLFLASQAPDSPFGPIPTPPPASTPTNGSDDNPPTSATAAPTQNPPNSSPNGFLPPDPLMPFSFVVGPTLAFGPDGASIVDPSIMAASLEGITAELQATGISEQFIAQVMNVFASIPPGDLSLFPPAFGSPRRPHFDAVKFVDTLEQVDLSMIPEEDLKCPHCWLPFGTTDEDDPTFVFAPDADESPELAVRQVALHEMPFCEARPDNNPVRTPCGHLFGRSCLIETMEKVDTLCPTCRKELRPAPKVPDAAE